MKNSDAAYHLVDHTKIYAQFPTPMAHLIWYFGVGGLNFFLELTSGWNIENYSLKESNFFVENSKWKELSLVIYSRCAFYNIIQWTTHFLTKIKIGESQFLEAL